MCESQRVQGLRYVPGECTLSNLACSSANLRIRASSTPMTLAVDWRMLSSAWFLERTSEIEQKPSSSSYERDPDLTMDEI
jgi:hypothetical protein